MRTSLLAIVGAVLFLLSQLPSGAVVLPPGYRIEPVSLGLESPGAAALAPDGRIFYLERTTGLVRILRNGRLLPDPFVALPVAQGSEEGLLGIALHPAFEMNGFVYLYYTQASPRTNRIVRYTAAGDRGTAPLVILDGIGAASNGEDNGGALAFGADGKLYVGVGVMAEDWKAKALEYLAGKILRLNDDGSVPPDNPFASSPGVASAVWALGFRNPASVAMHAGAATVYATDNYDDEPGAGCDEVNVVRPGLDYGWDGAANTCAAAGSPPAPMQDLVPPVVASGLASYAGSAYPSVCSNRPEWTCADKADCRTCANRPDQACAADSDCRSCSHDPARVCFSSDGSDCGSCLLDPAIACVLDWQCGSQGPCVFHACIASTCKDHPCVAAAGDLFVAGASTGTIARDVLAAPGYDAVTSSAKFYDPAGASHCPAAIRDLRPGADGWVYAASADTAQDKRGLWRVVRERSARSGAAPREVSGSPYLRLTVSREPDGGIRTSWEDLKREAWGCTTGHCPQGSHAYHYTVWSGPLSSPFGYAHGVLAETDGARETDALLAHVERPAPVDSRYYLVSARGANLEGTTGRASSGAERPGYESPDLCEVIGKGSPSGDLNRCAGEWEHPYPDQFNRPRTFSEFRGKAVYLSIVSDT